MKIDIVVRSELTGDDSCSALGFTAKSFSPVLALCRQLVEAGHDPSMPLEAWRGDVLCLRVRSIGEAAGLEINPRGTGFQTGGCGGYSLAHASKRGGRYTALSCAPRAPAHRTHQRATVGQGRAD
jgi:hypothetical protein